MKTGGNIDERLTRISSSRLAGATAGSVTLLRPDDSVHRVALHWWWSPRSLARDYRWQ